MQNEVHKVSQKVEVGGVWAVHSLGFCIDYPQIADYLQHFSPRIEFLCRKYGSSHAHGVGSGEVRYPTLCLVWCIEREEEIAEESEQR